ncbi:MAG: TorF family putative porin [Armatimonadota bacterium]
MNFDLTYTTEYVSRGLIANNDSTMQPSLTFTHPSGLSFNWWGSIDTTDIAEQKGNVTEIDYTLNYEWSIGRTYMNAGVSCFDYPDSADASTSEVYASICLDTDLSPTLSINYDFDEFDGAYIGLGINRCCNLPSSRENPLVMGLSAKIGYGTSNYNGGCFGVRQSAFNDLLLSASVPVTVSDKLTVTPYINYSTLLDDDLKTAVRADGDETSILYGGVTCSFPL